MNSEDQVAVLHQIFPQQQGLEPHLQSSYSERSVDMGAATGPAVCAPFAKVGLKRSTCCSLPYRCACKLRSCCRFVAYLLPVALSADGCHGYPAMSKFGSLMQEATSNLKRSLLPRCRHVSHNPGHTLPCDQLSDDYYLVCWSHPAHDLSFV